MFTPIRMGGGLLQLNAVGAQDAFLMHDPQITFFKQVYRRHANFASEVVDISFDGDAEFGRRITCTFPRQADLVHHLYLKVTLPALSSAAEKWTQHVGLAMIERVEVDIGGKTIDSMTGEWLYAWHELTLTSAHKTAFYAMVNGFNENDGTLVANRGERTVYVPLPFWFCRHSGLALPLVALAYHDVKVHVYLREASALAASGFSAPSASIVDAKLMIEYMYLDNDERKRFSQNHHEILFEYVQYNGNFTMDYPLMKQSIKLGFKHPIKEMLWFTRDQTATTTNEWLKFNNLTSGLPLLKQAKITLNAQDRIQYHDARYFSVVEPFQHHTSGTVSVSSGTYYDKGIYSYSFAMRPEEYQPTGSINFSRIDIATLDVEMDAATTTGLVDVFVYGITYNVLRIQGGMGGIAFY